jgi:H+/Cl- antiporter ClcA
MDEKLEKEKSNNYHALAKDAGNKLRAYILAISSGSIAIIFNTLVNANQALHSKSEINLLLFSALFFLLTIALSLYELRIDAKRVYTLGMQHSLKEESRDWSENEKYKGRRLPIIYSGYLFLGLAVLCIFLFMCKSFVVS